MEQTVEEQFEGGTISERFRSERFAFTVPAPIGAREWSEVLPAEVASGE